MTDIPERIWLDVSIVDSPRKTLAVNLATAKPERAMPTDVEYVLATRIAELEEDVARLQSFNRALRSANDMLLRAEAP